MNFLHQTGERCLVTAVPPSLHMREENIRILLPRICRCLPTILDLNRRLDQNSVRVILDVLAHLPNQNED